MGQYYQAFTMKGDNIEKYVSFDYDNGMKLTEHSYIGNSYTNAIYHEIHNNPMRVAWIGDYSDDLANNEARGAHYLHKIDFHKDFMPCYEYCWDWEALPRKIRFKKLLVTSDSKFRYLVNHTTKQYIDLCKYINQYEHKKYIYDPLPLLTACGNGLGGGDYFGENKNIIGIWAFDVLELVCQKRRIDGYQEFKIKFDEVDL